MNRWISYFSKGNRQFAGDVPVAANLVQMEAMLSLFWAILRRGNRIHDSGYMESGLTGSLELVVICDEIISWLKASLQELEINTETLALDVIHEHALSYENIPIKAGS